MAKPEEEKKEAKPEKKGNKEGLPEVGWGGHGRSWHGRGPRH